VTKIIIIIDWNTFHTKFLNRSTIYVKETELAYEFYTQDTPMIIKSVVEKGRPEENILFIERYLSGPSNIIKVMEIIGDDTDEEEIEEQESLEVSDESLRQDEIEEIADEL